MSYCPPAAETRCTEHRGGRLSGRLFSQAQSSTKVPVDFTQVKFVKKPAAAKPGMVVYTNYQTVLADPNEELVKHLLVK